MIGDPGVSGVGEVFLAFFIASPMLLDAEVCPTLGLEKDPLPALIANKSLGEESALEAPAWT